jgi:hypothetical protein
MNSTSIEKNEENENKLIIINCNDNRNNENNNYTNNDIKNENNDIEIDTIQLNTENNEFFLDNNYFSNYLQLLKKESENEIINKVSHINDRDHSNKKISETELNKNNKNLPKKKRNLSIDMRSYYKENSNKEILIKSKYKNGNYNCKIYST